MNSLSFLPKVDVTSYLNYPYKRLVSWASYQNDLTHEPFCIKVPN